MNGRVVSRTKCPVRSFSRGLGELLEGSSDIRSEGGDAIFATVGLEVSESISHYRMIRVSVVSGMVLGMVSKHHVCMDLGV